MSDAPMFSHNFADAFMALAGARTLSTKTTTIKG